MNIVTNHVDEITKLKCEFKTLKEELLRNNKQIHDLQLRDMESIENMKLYLKNNRHLNERIKRLKWLILKNYLDRRGGALKITEWMNALNISPLDTDDVSKNDEFLEQLYSQIDTAWHTTNESGEATDHELDNIHIEKAREMNSDSIESILKYFDKPASVEKYQRTGDYATPKLNYPANVELKSVNSPPVLPSEQTNATCFSTKYDIRPIRRSSEESKIPKHKKRKDTKRNNCTIIRHRETSVFIKIVYLIVFVVFIGSLYYAYPLLLETFDESEKDEGFFHTLDTFIERVVPFKPTVERPSKWQMILNFNKYLPTWQTTTISMKNMYNRIERYFVT